MKKLTNKEAIERLSIKNPNVIFIDQYFSSRIKSKFKCLICGCKWIAIPKGVIDGKNGCPDCGKKKAAETIKYHISTDDFKNKVKKIFGDKLEILGEYVNFYSDIEVKCNICGYNWISKPTYLISGSGCYICGHKEKGKKQRKTNDEFNKNIKKIYGDKLTLLEEYIRGTDRIKVICNVCSHEWHPVSRRLLSRGCPKCNFSKGELLISKILKELNINFEEQYIFDGFKTDKNGTPIFDFVIFDDFNNIKSIIEYDGEQHFKSIKKWGGDDKLKRQQEIDIIKNNFCVINNIKLVRISYTELNKIDNNYIKNLL